MLVISFLLEGLGLYFLITNIIRTPEMLRRVLWTLVISGMLLGELSLHQQITGSFDAHSAGFSEAKETKTTVEKVPYPRLAGSL